MIIVIIASVTMYKYNYYIVLLVLLYCVTMYKYNYYTVLLVLLYPSIYIYICIERAR